MNALPENVSGLRVSVIGGGSWGTAFARMLARSGAATELVCREAEQAAAINRTRKNPDYLRDVTLPASLTAATFAENTLADAELAVVAVPSRVYREVIHGLAPRINPQAAVLSLSKGLSRGV